MVKNYMEIAVEHLLPKLLQDYKHVCNCEKCLDDIRAIALNHLKPLYVVTEQGNLYAKVNEMEIQFSADVLKELINAIDKVSKNPKHNH
ncbi:late competence development ComFB family protein [Clostridium sp.]|uniref:late competence development ComFB family protein n=1 Tax=Clostridium sp. TaxID=1506 RepID=UPI002FC676AB